ncbi:NUDIX hydrolase [Paenarthrobacter sp. NPDC018779]|uniref:NUDIX hydrolase n=1 Tax=Paenarthrobacter sp. NPDC018779 TaxID=3364375 RepID=UPI0037CC7976
MNSEKKFLASYRPEDYPATAVTVDLVVLAVAQGVLHVALVRRGEHPFKGSLALPGGFLHPDEDALHAAWRELAEETGMTLPSPEAHAEQLATYSSPDRDPRMRIVSIAHLVLLATDGLTLPPLAAGSDAAGAEWSPVHETLKGDLAFDHAAIMREGLDRLSGKMEYTLIAARLLPESFTVTQLRTVYDAVWNTSLPAGNFTRKMVPQLHDTGQKVRAASGGAPAALFNATDKHIHPPLARPADARDAS